MYLPKDASRNRIREAQKARENRAEIVKARSHGQISRRELFRWGLFTTSGLLVCKNGFSAYAPSAYGQVPTGTPRSPLFGARKFTQPFRRLEPADADAADPERDRRGACFPPARASTKPSGSPTTRTSTTWPIRPTTRSAIRSPTAGRWKAARRERFLRTSAGTSSSPRSAT